MKNIFELPPEAKKGVEEKNKDKQEIARYGENFERELARKRDEMKLEAKKVFAEKITEPVHNFVVDVKENKEYGGRFKRFVNEAKNLSI